MNYIRHLQDKIQELSDKRDCLKKLSNTSNNVAPDCPTSCLECSCVTVEPCWAGVEVLVSTGFTQGLPLSRVLSVLTSEDLSIVSCSSTKVNGMLLHSTESEVQFTNSWSSLSLLFHSNHSSISFSSLPSGEWWRRSIDVSELQKKISRLKSQDFKQDFEMVMWIGWWGLVCCVRKIRCLRSWLDF